MPGWANATYVITIVDIASRIRGRADAASCGAPVSPSLISRRAPIASRFIVTSISSRLNFARWKRPVRRVTASPREVSPSRIRRRYSIGVSLGYARKPLRPSTPPSAHRRRSRRGSRPARRRGRRSRHRSSRRSPRRRSARARAAGTRACASATGSTRKRRRRRGPPARPKHAPLELWVGRRVRLVRAVWDLRVGLAEGVQVLQRCGMPVVQVERDRRRPAPARPSDGGGERRALKLLARRASTRSRSRSMNA